VHSYSIKSRPSSISKEEFDIWLKNNSIRRIRHIAGLNMIQSILGIIEGSTRHRVPLFNVILSGKINQQKPTIFVRGFVTEGIVFQLEYLEMLKWFEENQLLIDAEERLKWDKNKNPVTEY